MKVFRPSENPITQGYSVVHPAYDFAGNGLPDAVRAGMDGVIVERVDLYDSNWTATGTLTTKDYGNYLKIRHTDGTFELHAHLRKGSSLTVGTNVTQGQIIARIGNTGNSSGPHVHSEFRDTQNRNTPVEFLQGGGATVDIDTVRKERDKNWNLYQTALKDQEGLRNDRDKNWNLYQEALKNQPTADPKALKALQILKDIKEF